MKSRWLALFSVAVAALAVGVSACGSQSGSDGTVIDSKTLTVYSSLPLHGDSRPQSQDVVRGIRIALRQAGGRVGDFKLKYVSLVDSTVAVGKWDPRQVSANARKAAEDKNTIAYIGEFNSGASVVSIPIINRAGILQISPSNTYVGLTRSEGAEKGEPNKHYPAGRRTFGRVVPADHIQAAAAVAYMKGSGCSSVYILNDTEVYGKGLASQIAQLAPKQGMTVKGNDGVDSKAASFRSVAGRIKASGANCFFFGGITQNKGVQIFTDVFGANPNIMMFGPDGVAESQFTKGLSRAAQQRTFITAPTGDPKSYPPAAQKFFRDFRAAYGKDPEPYAIYGYESMSLILNAMRRAGDQANDRSVVINRFFTSHERDSVLGSFKIDKNGDTTLSDYGAYKVLDSKLVLNRVLKAKR